jgi:LysR family transcriptional regulator, transcriptional activator of the cysJI operon
MPRLLDNVKLFADVAASRSVSRAALMNGVSQSAVSQHLHEAEQALGVQLLDRSTRPLQLTEAGHLYFEFCQAVLRRKQRFEDALDQLRGRAQNAVRVAAIYSVGISDISRLKSELLHLLPEATLEVEYLHSKKVHEAVLMERADLGLLSYPEPDKEIATIPWRQEQMMVVLAPSHPLAPAGVLRSADLAQQDFVAFDDDLRVGWEVKRYLRERGVEVRVVMHFDNIQTMKEALTLGTSISILPVRVLRNDLEQGRLRAIPIEDCTLVRPMGVIHRRSRRFNRATQAFLDLLLSGAAAEDDASPLGARFGAAARLARSFDEDQEGSGE